MKKRFTEEQIMATLKHVKSGKVDFSRKKSQGSNLAFFDFIYKQPAVTA